MSKRVKYLAVLSLAIIVSLFALPIFAQQPSQGDLGLGVVGQNIALGGGDIRVTIVRILNYAFGFLGIVMVGIVIYAGILYMMSGGDPTKTATARKWIFNAVIGLVIILSAFAITRFVLTSLESAIIPGGVGGPGGPGGGGGIGGSSSVFRVLSVTPNGDRAPTGWPRNSVVKINFTAAIQPDLIDQISVRKFVGSEAVSGAWNILGQVVEFTPAAVCPAPNADRKCFDADTEFRVTIGSGLRSVDGRAIYCGLGSDCDARFKIGSLVDTQAPTVSITSPLNGARVPQGTVGISVLANDDSGIARVEFFVDNISIGIEAASGEKGFVATHNWNALGLALGSEHELKAAAYDIDANLGMSGVIKVKIRATHCFNGRKDFDETDIDCGGVDCGACSGVNCASGSDCASGLCVNGRCVAGPVITSVQPMDGAPGNLVTIYGYNFGDAPGAVTLNGIAALSGCASAWSDKMIIMIVPQGASTGKIRVTNKANLSAETTSDFVVNDIIRPGICTIAPTTGLPGASYSITGRNFGADKGLVLFDTRLSDITSWARENISGAAPLLTDGRYVVRVKVGSEQSNGIYFTINPPVGGTPSIRSINPASGPPGEYITIFGSNFGVTTGQVLFSRGSDIADADTSFPEGCALAYWKNDNIVVKVPSAFRDRSSIGAGAFQIQIIRSDTYPSNKYDFTITAATPKPGICRLDPDNGPPGTKVNIFGERFGASADGKVNFWQNQEAQKVLWSSGSVAVKAPGGAQTGPVVLVSNGVLSNGINFRVSDCSKNSKLCNAMTEQCCGGSCIPVASECKAGVPRGSFLWRFSTGPIVRVPEVIERQSCEDGMIQSPSPWKASTDACVNAQISAQFNMSMRTAIPDGAVKVQDCTGSSGAFDAGACVIKSSEARWSTASDNLNDRIIITLVDSETGAFINLAPGHSYQVTLGKALASAVGVPMARDYVWRFRTISDPVGCSLARVTVSPRAATITESTKNKDYTADPTAANCNALKCGASYGFEWRAGDARAEVRNPRITSDALCQATAYPIKETGEVPVKIISRSTIYNKEGSGDLFIKYTPPQIVKYWPSSGCPAACSNVAVGEEFNVPMDAATITADNFEIYLCSDDTCSFTAATLAPAKIQNTSVSYNETTRIFDISAGLTAGKSYLVRVNGFNVQSVSGASLTNLNPAPYFQWKFKIKENAAICQVDRTEISPSLATLHLILARANYAAEPFGPPDECNPAGPLLQVRNSAGELNYLWTWGSSKPEVGAPVSVLYAEAVAPERDYEALGKGTTDVAAETASQAKKPTPPAQLVVECSCRFDAASPSVGDGDCAVYETNKTGPVGCAKDRCCMSRPKAISTDPADGRTDVCRNALIAAQFDQIMDQASFTVDSVKLEKCGTGASPTNCQPLVFGADYTLAFQNKTIKKNDTNVLATAMSFKLKALLDPTMWYRARILGEAKNTRGVAMASDSAWSFTWSFKTKNTICVLDKVGVDPSYHLFTTNDPNKSESKRDYSAVYISTAGGGQKVASVAGVYEWSSNWLSNDLGVANISGAKDGVDSVTVAAQKQNGAADIVVSTVVSGNAVPDSAPKNLGASGRAEVFICENIWPTPKLGETIFGLNDGTFNFRTFYCRDLKSSELSLAKPTSFISWLGSLYQKVRAQGTAKGEQILNLLPNMTYIKLGSRPDGGECVSAKCSLNNKPCATVQDCMSIEEEYLLRNPENKDAIGIRVLKNQNHLSPLRWYAEEKNFKGSPQPMQMNGYEAIQDGRSIYIAGANKNSATNQIDTVIYLLSYSEGASAETLAIFNQIVQNLTLNTNIDDKRVCEGGSAICSSDLDCPITAETAQSCDAVKSKLARDTRRLADISDIQKSLEAYRAKNDVYPQLTSGTFLRGTAVSKWSSWQDTLGKNLAAALPADPLNQFNKCERPDVLAVSATGGFTLNCQTVNYSDANASAAYSFNASKDGDYTLLIDTENRGSDLSDKSYSTIQPSAFCGGDGIYHHLKISVDGKFLGALCNLASSKVQNGKLSLGHLGAGNHRLEVVWDNDWYPNVDGVCGADKKCTLSKKDCASNVDCNAHYDSNLQIDSVKVAAAPLNKDTCWSDADQKLACPAGSHIYQYKNQSGTSYTFGIDFEYVMSPSMLGGASLSSVTWPNCRDGAIYGTSSVCGDGVVGFGEACELGQSRTIDCTLSGVSGVQKQTCFKKCDWTNDGACNTGKCGDGVKQSGEVCDDGALNGKYGYCAFDCKSRGRYCGDGIKNGDEKCDLGNQNGVYGSGCAWDCSGPGPQCGDGIVNGSEACDGNREIGNGEQLGISCSYSGTAQRVRINCRGNADCPTLPDGRKGTCNGYSPACTPRGGHDYAKTRTCSSSCTWNPWGECKPADLCGNGIVEKGEECDDGTNSTTGNCVLCQKARCGDGYTQIGVEMCDNGSQNDKPCTSFYGGTCNYCSSNCKLKTATGAYCGDKTISEANGEQCDGSAFNATCATYSFAVGNLKCSIDCKVDRNDCKTPLIATQLGLGDGTVQGTLWINGVKTDGSPVTLLSAANEPITTQDTTGGGGFTFSKVATCDSCSYRFRINYEPPPVSLNKFLQSHVPSFDNSKFRLFTPVHAFTVEENLMNVYIGTTYTYFVFSAVKSKTVTLCAYTSKDGSSLSVTMYESVQTCPPPGSTAKCGDGTINSGAGEQCDDGVNNGKICTPSYVATPSPANGCEYCDTSCHKVFVPSPYCGDTIKNGSEACDGTVPAGVTCSSLMGSGYGGAVSCNSACQYDTNNCAKLCGNGKIDAGEDCDGGNLNAQTCASAMGSGYTGTLSCNAASCKFDTTQCKKPVLCPNGVIDFSAGEVCDGSNLGAMTCNDLNYYGQGHHVGYVTCNPDCKSFNNSMCTICGNTVTEGIEECDRGAQNTNTNICASASGNCSYCDMECRLHATCNKTPQSTACYGKTCGTASDGCGGTYACGTCASPNTCGGGGIPDVCGCAKETDATMCSRLGKSCGSYTGADNCNSTRTVNCGSCSYGYYCSSNKCVPLAKCGDGIINGSEQCDGNTSAGLNYKSCGSFGYYKNPSGTYGYYTGQSCIACTITYFVSGKGTLSCNSDCTYNLTGCTTCGNNIINTKPPLSPALTAPAEICDGSALGGKICKNISYGSVMGNPLYYTGGTLKCKVDCSNYDTSSCTKL